MRRRGVDKRLPKLLSIANCQFPILAKHPLRRRHRQAAMAFVSFTERVAFGDGKAQRALDVVDFVVEGAKAEFDPIVAGREWKAFDDAIERPRAIEAFDDRS